MIKRSLDSAIPALISMGVIDGWEEYSTLPQDRAAVIMADMLDVLRIGAVVRIKSFHKGWIVSVDDTSFVDESLADCVCQAFLDYTTKG